MLGVMGDLNDGLVIFSENKNGRRVVNLCAERRLCSSNTYFKYKNVHEYTRMDRDRDRNEVMSVIDLVLGLGG